MFGIPSLPPTWDGLHPLIVHLPIGTLFVAPIIIIAALLIPKHERGLNLAAFLLMTVGVIGAFLAVSTGEAAAELVPETPPVGALLEQHEEAAETARTVFAVMLALFAAYTFGPWLAKKPWPRKLTLSAGVVFLALYAAPCLILANAGHMGGQLVHDHGVHARLSANAAAPASSAATTQPQGSNETNEESREHEAGEHR